MPSSTLKLSRFSHYSGCHLFLKDIGGRRGRTARHSSFDQGARRGHAFFRIEKLAVDIQAWLCLRLDEDIVGQPSGLLCAGHAVQSGPYAPPVCGPL